MFRKGKYVKLNLFKTPVPTNLPPGLLNEHEIRTWRVFIRSNKPPIIQQSPIPPPINTQQEQQPATPQQTDAQRWWLSLTPDQQANIQATYQASLEPHTDGQ